MDGLLKAGAQSECLKDCNEITYVCKKGPIKFSGWIPAESHLNSGLEVLLSKFVDERHWVQSNRARWSNGVL